MGKPLATHNYQSLSKRVQKQREDVNRRLEQLMGGRSQNRWAKELGVSQQNISRYMNGQAPHLEFLIHLANREEVNLNWLILGEGRKFRNAR